MMDDKYEVYFHEIRHQRRPVGRREHWDEKSLVIRGSSLKWFDGGSLGNPSKIAPVLDLPVKSFEVFIQEIPAGGASDMQRHQHETVHIVTSGSGYSEIGGRSLSWGEGDFIYTPPMVWHRHYNGDPQNPVRMIGIENSRLLDHLLLNYRESRGEISWAELPAADREDP